MMQSLIPVARFVATMMLASPALADPASLYTRLGGEAVVSQVVDQVVNTITQDPRVNRSFDQVNLVRLKSKLIEHVCAITGGGCVYTGDEIKQVHKGLKITEFEFYAQVAALRQALDEHGVGEREKNELLAILAPMKRLVVEK
jgi:hemoglobin